MIKRYDAYVSSSKIKGPRFVDEIESEFGTLCQASDVLELISQKDGEIAELVDLINDAIYSMNENNLIHTAGDYQYSLNVILAKYQKE